MNSNAIKSKNIGLLKDTLRTAEETNQIAIYTNA